MNVNMLRVTVLEWHVQNANTGIPRVVVMYRRQTSHVKRRVLFLFCFLNNEAPTPTISLKRIIQKSRINKTVQN